MFINTHLCSQAHKRLAYKTITPMYSFTRKNITVSLGHLLHPAWPMYSYFFSQWKYFLKSQVKAPSRQAKDQAKLIADCSVSTSEQSQSRCRHPPTFSLSRQVFSCLLSHHRPGPSRRHPSLGHNTSSCFSSSHSFSLPVCYPQRAQSKHLKTENRLRLCSTETPLTPCTGLTVNTPSWLYMPTPALLTLRPLHVPLSCHPHTSATLVSFYSC